ncbi:MAG: hypothetical protein C0592_00930 [Marinilabiliales bacterium]|nr:MAG: hypothetical protein C0592_00930 [Marinilabiliales bacterium]
MSEPSCKVRVMQKWELLSQEGKFDEAIIELNRHIDSTGNKSKHQNYWHLGQLYAFNNDYDTAVQYMKKSTSIFDLMFDKYWRLYYKGTIAFLQRDKEKLQKYYLKLLQHNSAYYERNTKTLESLYLNFDEQYFDAYFFKSH